MFTLTYRVFRVFQRLSLQPRFLIAPLLAACLLGLITGGLLLDGWYRTSVLTRLMVSAHDVEGTDLARLRQLTSEHLALLEAPVAQRPGLVHTVMQRLHEMEEPPMGEVPAALLTVLHQTAHAYQDAAAHASTNAGSWSDDRIELNQRFAALSRAYVQVANAQRQAVETSAAQELAFSVRNHVEALIVGLLASLGLTGLAVGLARRLANDLNRQAQALNALSDQSLAVDTSDSGHEIDRITAAIAAFRRSQLQLSKKEQVLALTNEALVTTLEQLDATRGDLERRVNERTEELQEINGDLLAEVERRRVVEQELLIYAEAIRSTGEAVVITDGQGTILEVNPAYEAVIGASSAAIVGQRMFEALPDNTSEGTVIDPDLDDAMAIARGHRVVQPTVDPTEPGGVVASHATIWDGLLMAGHWSGETLALRHDGSSFPCLVHANAVVQHHEQSERFVFVLRDITLIKQSEQQLTHMAFHDPLTALPNRAMFNARLNAAVQQARQGAGAIAVLYMDLDRFKDVNDTLGHPAGDQLLKEVANRLEQCVRSSDTLARLGGDEFTVLLRGACTRATAEIVACRIIACVNQPIDLGGTPVNVGVSIGISLFDGTFPDGLTEVVPMNDAQLAETLQKHADMALYDAKGRGRGQHRFFTADLVTRSDRRLSLSVQIERAIKNQEFVLHYQPIVNVITGVTQSVEALIRWRNPQGEWISPGTFIPHAEEAGFIKRIDTWVIHQACTDAQAWVSSGRNLAVSVNLSAVSVQQLDTVEVVAHALRETGLPARYLSIEITETAMIADSSTARTVLQGLADLGVSLSFDDFGTGYSSLSYLTQFPIRSIKLDRSFIERIGRNDEDDEVVRSILDMAKRLHLRVIAEGVEDEAQQSFLLNAGCDLIQGFFIGRPMPGDQLHRWLQDRYGCAPMWEEAGGLDSTVLGSVIG